MALNAGTDFYARRTAEAYQEYQAQLRRNNALDFDDLIMKTVELFQNCPEVLDNYQERFRYIMVDEYQDTNTAQFRLVSLLASKYRNLCVVATTISLSTASAGRISGTSWILKRYFRTRG